MTVQHIAEQFDLGGRVVEVSPYGRGLINDTYLVTTDMSTARAVLQRINPQVFPHPALIMENLRTLLDHVHTRQADMSAEQCAFRMATICKTQAGADYHQDSAGAFWRALSFIENTCCCDTITDLDQAEQVGFALGRFHALVSDLEPGSLHDTLPGFHITPHYLQRFDAVAAQIQVASSTAELRFCFAFIGARRQWAGVLEDAKQRGLLPVRPIHGDPKLNNILFDARNGLAVSLVDLDTMKPGLVHYDIGDCLRSCCNTVGEYPGDPATVNFDLDICQAILKGYFLETGGMLNRQDYAYAYEAIRLIPFELGLRFLTDYLEGNRYFKVAAPEQNLYRAMTQFQLVNSIERNENRIRQLIADTSTGLA